MIDHQRTSMTSSAQVTLKTEGGKWKHTTTLDDPIFSDILAPYIDLGETPEEVLLEGSVAQVIEKEWDWWRSLPAQYTTGKLLPHIRRYSPSLDQFATILNIPPHWMLYVIVDRKSMSHELLVNHYIQLTEVLKTINKDPEHDRASSQCIVSMLDYLPQGGPSWATLIGVAWVAWLEWVIPRHTEECALFMMDWDTFSTVVASDEDVKEEDRGALMNTIALLRGKGSLTSPANLGFSSRPTWDELALYKRLITNRVEYDSISLSTLGLGFLVEDYDADYNIPEALLQIRMIHTSAIREGMRHHLPSRDPPPCMADFASIVASVYAKLGLEGLCFVYNIVDYHFTHGNYVGTHYRRINVFRAFLEQAIIDSQEKE